MKPKHFSSYILILSTFFTACGGSGENGGTTPPASPANVLAVPGNAQITINWQSVTEATSYNLYWNTTGSVNTSSNKITNVTSPYIHTGRTNTTTYYYRVSAVNSAGEGVLSTEVSATPVLPTGSISGSVAGTEIIALNNNGEIVARDDTTGKSPNGSGNYQFTLNGIPVGVSVRLYLITGAGVYPLYVNGASTNIFMLNTIASIDLGFVDVSGGTGKALPENDPANLASVDVDIEDQSVWVLLTDEETGNPLPGVTIVVDHATDPRQIKTTSVYGAASFSPPSSGNVTVTVGYGGKGLSLADFKPSFIQLPLRSDATINAYIQGTASNFTGPGGVVLGGDGDDLTDQCSGCENLSDLTSGFFKLKTTIPNKTFNLSAFDFGSDISLSNPVNFTAVTGLGPLTDAQTITANLTFPSIAPASTFTTGSISVPASLGIPGMVQAVSASDLTTDNGQLLTGVSILFSGPFNYSLKTFDFSESGSKIDLFARAITIAGAVSQSVKRNASIGGSGVNFNLIDVATNLAPNGSCGGITPTLTWDAVAGASVYIVKLIDSDTDWTIVVDGSSNSFSLPNFSSTPISMMGLTATDTVTWSVEAIVLPEYDLNNLIRKRIQYIFTDYSVGPAVSCLP